MADQLPCKKCGHYAVACDDSIAHYRAEIARLEQVIDYEAIHTQDPSTYANLSAAMVGDYLYEKMPGWSDRKPLEEPKQPETQEVKHGE